MIEQSAEEAAHALARTIVNGDVGGFVRSVTADAFSKTMEIGNTTWKYHGYELTARGQTGEDFIFDIKYQTDRGAFLLGNRFRRLDGAWKLVDIEQLG